MYVYMYLSVSICIYCNLLNICSKKFHAKLQILFYTGCSTKVS